MLRHRIYGSIIFLSRPARCFHFDLALIFYAQTSRSTLDSRCIGASASGLTDRHIISAQDEHDFLFLLSISFRRAPQCVLSKTGNKSRLLRWVLVARWWEIIRMMGSHTRKRSNFNLYDIAHMMRVQICFHLITSFTLSFRPELPSFVTKLFRAFRFQWRRMRMELLTTPNRI